MIGYLILGFVAGFFAAIGLYCLAYWQWERVCTAIERAVQGV